MFTFEVLVKGRPVQEYLHEGITFIEGHRNSEYTLRVHNNARCRAVAVFSVDGLSVMTGKLASRSDSGYVIGAYGSVEVPGWRLNNDEVAHFFFGSLPESYASQMDKPQNIGVIGASIYLEHIPKSLSYHKLGDTLGGGSIRRTRGMTRGAPSLGTGFGRRTEHQTHEVQFDREDSPAAEMVIRYEDAAALRARGIDLQGAHKKNDAVLDARPFPGDDHGVPSPPGWRG